jgi:hypothetical protein
MGATGYIHKPIDPQGFEDRLRELLRLPPRT